MGQGYFGESPSCRKPLAREKLEIASLSPLSLHFHSPRLVLSPFFFWLSLFRTNFAAGAIEALASLISILEKFLAFRRCVRFIAIARFALVIPKSVRILWPIAREIPSGFWLVVLYSGCPQRFGENDASSPRGGC